MLLPLNDTQFLAIQIGAPKHIAAACCGRVALDTMVYFLGAEAKPAINVLMATGVEGGELAASPIDEAIIRDAIAARATPSPAGGPESEGPKWGAIPPNRRVERATIAINPVTHAVLRLEPIWSVGQEAVVSYLLAASIFHQVGETLSVTRMSDLAPRAALAYATEAVQFASRTLDEAARVGTRFAIHIPIPVEAFSVTNGRHELVRALQDLPQDQRQLIIVEISKCGVGMPHSRMLDLVSIVRPFCRAVLARVDKAHPPPRHWFEAGLTGVTAELDGTEDKGERSMMRRLEAFVEAAAGARRLVVAHGLRHRGLALSAWANGFTHISGQIVTDQADASGRAVRLTGADIFMRGV